MFLFVNVQNKLVMWPDPEGVTQCAMSEWVWYRSMTSHLVVSCNPQKSCLLGEGGGGADCIYCAWD